MGAVQSELSAIASENVNSSFRDSISLSPTSTLLVDDVQAAIKRDTYGHNVDIYPTLMDAPYYIQQQVLKERVSPEGFFDPSTNRVALILENLDSVKRAVEVARHELVGHYGLENMLNEVDPEILPKLLNSITMVRRTGLNPVINELSEEVLASQPALVVKPTDTAEQAKKKNDRIAKEIIAFMAEKNIQNDTAATSFKSNRSCLTLRCTMLDNLQITLATNLLSVESALSCVALIASFPAFIASGALLTLHVNLPMINLPRYRFGRWRAMLYH